MIESGTVGAGTHKRGDVEKRAWATRSVGGILLAW